MKGAPSLLTGSLILLWSVGVASAQSLGGGFYATYGTTHFVASESFDATTGTTSDSSIGVGGVVTGLWRGLFVDIGYTQHELIGERVFIDHGTVYSLGIPLRITMRPIDLAGGWRFHAGRVSPYAGGGLTFLSYREESDFSVAGEDVDERKRGGLVLVGADVRLVRLVSVGGEVRFRSVGDVLGSAGVSQIFGEEQLGGSSFAARVLIGR